MIRFVWLSVFFVPVCIASADLVEVTDANFPGGTNNITRDTATGLEWLDWTATTDISYNDMITQLGPGDTFEGWRHATRTEVGTLFSNMGVLITDWPNSTANADSGASAALGFSLLGKTVPASPLFSDGGTAALVADATNGSNVARFRAELLVHQPHTIARSAFGQIDTGSSPIAGHALVRAAVPEPSSAACLLFVLLCCGYGKRRKMILTSFIYDK
ncbi:MAG: hypothetical protein AAF497_12515 [Planctomycetota bacterium]